MAPHDWVVQLRTIPLAALLPDQELGTVASTCIEARHALWVELDRRYFLYVRRWRAALFDARVEIQRLRRAGLIDEGALLLMEAEVDDVAATWR